MSEKRSTMAMGDAVCMVMTIAIILGLTIYFAIEGAEDAKMWRYNKERDEEELQHFLKTGKIRRIDGE